MLRRLWHGGMLRLLQVRSARNALTALPWADLSWVCVEFATQHPRESVLNESIETQLHELAVGCRVLHMEGHADLTLGHLAYRDPAGRGVWLKRSGIALAEVRGPADFVLLDWNGRRLAGEGRIHKEWPIHTEIMKARPDVVVCGHSHPFHATLFSALDVALEPVTNEAAYLGGPPGRFDMTTGLIDAPALGAGLAAALGAASTVLMRNHGISYVGASVAQCVLMGLFLERACCSQLTLLSTSQPYHSTPRAELEAKLGQILDEPLVANFWAFYQRRLAVADLAG